jgi:hypothetical protein
MHSGRVSTANQGDVVLTRFRSLGCLVDEDRPELELCQSGIARSDTRNADDVRGIENVPLAPPDERLVLSLVALTQFSLIVAQLNELLQFGMGIGIGDLIVQRQERDGRVECLAGFGSDTDDFESGLVDLLAQVIHGDVGWRADEDLARIHLGEVVDDRG